MSAATKTLEVPSYSVVVGLDFDLLMDATTQWTHEKVKIFESLRKAYDPLPEDPKELMTLFVEYGLADFHWDWTRKALVCNGDEYIWMFLLTPDRRVQAISILFHPKFSRLDGLNIFYIDYLATAYWNRGKNRKNAEFRSAATTLIRAGIRHITDTYGYRPGFSLHSLPSAISFYEKLGLTRFEEDREKENLVYFEASHEVASALALELKR